MFSVTLRQIGAYINRMHVADAIDVICNGDGNKNGADQYTVGTKPIAGTAGTLSYDALVDFWSQFDPYTMNTLLVGDAMAQILKLEEMQDSTAVLSFSPRCCSSVSCLAATSFMVPASSRRPTPV